MNITQPIIDEDLPFKHCKLGRSVYGIHLTKLIRGFENGGVMAINNRWGYGKTTFIKMWERQLELEGYSTIYFNAWENDFEDNPLAALMAELNERLKDKGNFKELVKYGGKLLISVAGSLTKHVAEKYIGNETVKTITNGLTENVEKIFQAEIDEYIQKKDSILKFKSALQSYISSNTEKVPLVFFIDELDRCKPNYAVKVLEVIKHVFAVPNLLFVLSIDKEQLGHSINGFYGSEKFDSEDYLRRFIDLEYSLPESDIKDFIYYQLKSHGIIEFIRLTYGEGENYFQEICVEFFGKMPLRKIEKIIIHLKITLLSKAIHYDDFSLLLYLIYLKFQHTNLYIKLFSKKLDLSQVRDIYYEVYKKDFESVLDESERFFASVEADLLFSYFNGFRRLNNKLNKLYVMDGSDITFEFRSEINNSEFERALEQLVKYQRRALDWDNIITNIELIKIY